MMQLVRESRRCRAQGPRRMRRGVCASVIPRLQLPSVVLAVILTAAAVSACGGGDTPEVASPGQEVAVSSLIASDAMYGQALLITVAGIHLDAALSVISPGCKDVTRSTTAPYVSTGTTAYFRCTASAVGASQITLANAQGVTLATAAFTVPSPQVTLSVTNGLGVNGAFVIELFPEQAPITVDNFLAYVNAGSYDGTVFHRLLPGFVVQGGGYLPFLPGASPVAKPANPPIQLEVNKGLSNLQWTVAMARSVAADSASSQFFVNLVNNSAALDPGASSAGYAVFGKVVSGTDTVVAIASAPCAPAAGVSECAGNPSVRITSASQTQ